MSGLLFACLGYAGVTGFNIYSMFVAVIGAIVVLLIYHMVVRRAQPTPHGRVYRTAVAVPMPLWAERCGPCFSELPDKFAIIPVLTATEKRFTPERRGGVRAERESRGY